MLEGVKIFERYGRCRRPVADPRQPTEIASSFARRYVWESTGSWVTRPVGADTDSTVVRGSHS